MFLFLFVLKTARKRRKVALRICGVRAEDEVCLCPVHRGVCMWSAGFCFGCVPVILPIPTFLSCEKPILSSRLKRKFGRRSVFGETLSKLNSPQQWHIPPPPLGPDPIYRAWKRTDEPTPPFPYRKDDKSLSLSSSPFLFLALFHLDQVASSAST